MPACIRYSILYVGTLSNEFMLVKVVLDFVLKYFNH